MSGPFFVSLRKGVFPIVPVKMTRVVRVIRLARARFRHGAAGRPKRETTR